MQLPTLDVSAKSAVYGKIHDFQGFKVSEVRYIH